MYIKSLVSCCNPTLNKLLKEPQQWCKLGNVSHASQTLPTTSSLSQRCTALGEKVSQVKLKTSWNKFSRYVYEEISSGTKYHFPLSSTSQSCVYTTGYSYRELTRYVENLPLERINMSRVFIRNSPR